MGTLICIVFGIVALICLAPIGMVVTLADSPTARRQAGRLAGSAARSIGKHFAGRIVGAAFKSAKR